MSLKKIDETYLYKMFHFYLLIRHKIINFASIFF